LSGWPEEPRRQALPASQEALSSGRKKSQGSKTQGNWNFRARERQERKRDWFTVRRQLCAASDCRAPRCWQWIGRVI